MRSVEKATTFGLDIRSTNLFNPQMEYLDNLRRFSLVRYSPFSPRQPWNKTPNLRFLKVGRGPRSHYLF